MKRVLNITLAVIADCNENETTTETLDRLKISVGGAYKSEVIDFFEVKH